MQRTFIDQDSKEVHLGQFEDKTLVLAYIYTSCPIQTMCPATTKRMVELQQRLPEDLEGRIQLICITLDPERDPPSALRTYGEFYGVDFSSWSMLTADRATIEASAACCNVSFEQEENGMIGHNMNIILIDSEGQIAAEVAGADWSLPGVIARLRTLASPETRPSSEG